MGTFPIRTVGVTGFTAISELQLIQRVFKRLVNTYEDCFSDNKPKLMAGILATNKTISSDMVRTSRRYPYPIFLSELFLEAYQFETLGLCHFYTDDPENLIRDCELIQKMIGIALQGFQFNLCWPDPLIINELHERNQYLHIVLQIGKKALKEYEITQEGEWAGYDVDRFMKRIGPYRRNIDSVLLDPSGGEGERLIARQLAPLVEALMQIDDIGIGVAGGLCADTLREAAMLMDICPYLSIDAEARLMDVETGILDLKKAQEYVSAAFAQFCPGIQRFVKFPV